jgi:hypothetical protein
MLLQQGLGLGKCYSREKSCKLLFFLPRKKYQLVVQQIKQRNVAKLIWEQWHPFLKQWTTYRKEFQRT